MTRRNLFTMVPAASVLFALRSKGAPITDGARTAAGFGIGVQCWSFKEFTLFEAIEMAAAAGMGGLELYAGQRIGGDHCDAKFSPGMGDELVGAVKGKIKEHGLAAYNLGVIAIPNKEGDARKIFDLAKSLELYGVTTESIESIDLLEKLAQEYDLKVCFHNHPKPTKLWNPDTISKAIEGRHENLGFCADVGHWASSGLDPLQVVKKIAPRVHSFHMKDRASITEPTHDRPFGTGVIDIVGILDEVRRHGFAGNVSIEYEHNWKTSLPEVAQCGGFLRGYSKCKA